MGIKSSIYCLIDQEKTLEYKLDLLTAIGTASTSEEVFRVCEEIRDQIVPDQIQESREQLLRGSNLIGVEDDKDEKSFNEMDGE
jgi:hypothetical protein